jgi:hypothetical protein
VIQVPKRCGAPEKVPPGEDWERSICEYHSKTGGNLSRNDPYLPWRGTDNPSESEYYAAKCRK